MEFVSSTMCFHQWQQPFVGPQMEDVIDEDAPSEAGSDDNMQVMEENVHVEALIPAEQINPDEIHPDELMEFPEEEDQVNQIQLGFVQLIESSADPIFRHSGLISLHLAKPTHLFWFHNSGQIFSLHFYLTQVASLGPKDSSAHKL